MGLPKIVAALGAGIHKSRVACVQQLAARSSLMRTRRDRVGRYSNTDRSREGLYLLLVFVAVYLLNVVPDGGDAIRNVEEFWSRTIGGARVPTKPVKTGTEKPRPLYSLALATAKKSAPWKLVPVEDIRGEEHCVLINSQLRKIEEIVDEEGYIEIVNEE